MGFVGGTPVDHVIVDSGVITSITNKVAVTAADGDLYNRSKSVADTGNSTTTPLGIGATFTGTAFDMTDYATWSVTIFADQASATNGLKVDWSIDGTNWDFTDQVTAAASVGNMITFGRKARYVRLRYVNGAVGQSTFRVGAAAQPVSVRQTRKFVGTTLQDADTGQVVIAGIQGHTTAGGGAWVDVKVNPSGTLTVDASNSTALSTLVTLSTTARTTRAIINAAASGDNTLIAGTGGQTIGVFKMFFVCDSAVDLYFRDGTGGTALTGTMKMGPGGAFTLDLDDDPWFVTSSGNAFVVNLSAAVGIRGRLYYTKS